MKKTLNLKELLKYEHLRQYNIISQNRLPKKICTERACPYILI